MISMFTLSSVISVGAEPASGQVLVWSDEFDGTSLNTSNWVYDVGYGYWGNEELEYYRSGTNNIVVKDGALAITAKKESYGGASYTSGRITTYNKQSFQYGTIEARIKMPVGQGLWPAFWMLSNSASWPDGGEIDIMEHINSETVAYGTAHDWNGGNTKSQGGTFYNVDVTEYHVYTIQWTEEYIKWFVDDKQYYEVDISMDNTFFPNKEVFHEPYYLLLNVAVGGTWPGDPVNSSFPGTMYVDYVRVYQDSDEPIDPEEPTDPDDASYPTWNANTVYNTGDRVAYEGKIYEAKYWTQGNNPSTSSGDWSVWTYIGDISAESVAATGITLYKDGASVANNGSVSVTDADVAMSFTAAVTPDNATNKNYTITVSNSAVASVSGTTATVTPANATEDTSVVITATSEDGSYKASYTVNIDYTEPVVEPTSDVFVFKINDSNVLYANQNLKFPVDAPAQFVDGKTLVPLRAIGSAVGIEDLVFDSDTFEITFTGYDGYTVEMTVDSTECTLTKGGVSQTISITAPVLIDGITMLPLRDATALVGGTVKFDDLGTTDTGYVVVSGGTFEDADVAGYIAAYEAI